MPFLFDLGFSQSNRVIEQAVRRRAEITLEPRSWPDHEALPVVVFGSGERFLHVETVAKHDLPLESLVGVHLDAQMTLGQTLYIFDSHLTDIDYDRTKPALLLNRPRTLKVVQRRRFQRKALRSTCRVHLDPDPGGNGGPVTGELLNLSPDGMACRLGEEAAGSMPVGQRLHVAFCPQDAESGFEFDAVLTNKSQAGSEGNFILGLAFRAGPERRRAKAERERLCEFLYTQSNALVTQEDAS